MMVMPHLTLQIKPVPVRKEYAKGYDFAGQHLANRVEVATAIGKIGDARGVSFLSAVPNRIKAHTQTWFRPSIIHDPSIIEFLTRQWKVFSICLDCAADFQCLGNDLERGGKFSRKFSVDFQMYFRARIRRANDNSFRERMADFRHG